MIAKALIQQSIDYIEDNLQADISAAELAQAAGFSLYHYCRLFRAYTGFSVNRYILRRRLLYAMQKMQRGHAKTEAALQYGFETYSGFYRAVSREFGCTPSSFIQANQIRPYRINLYKEELMYISGKTLVTALSNWGLDNETIENTYYEHTGEQHDGTYYVGEDYVLKLTPNYGKLRNSVELSKAIASEGLYTAEPVPTLDGREYIKQGELYGFLMKRLPGKSYSTEQLLSGNCMHNARFYGEMIGRLHCALSQVEYEAQELNLYDKVRTQALQQVKECMHLDEDFCSRFLAEFSSLYEVLPRQIIHRDPNPSNIIVNGEKWGFIDFELSHRNVRIYDPVYASTAILSETFDTHRDIWLDIYRSIMVGYGSVVQLSEAERKAAAYVLICNQLICVAWFAKQEKYADVFETNKRMTAWLIEHFDELSVYP